MNKFFSVFFILVIVLFYGACKQPQVEAQVVFSITSPRENWVYYDDESIVFSVNGKAEKIEWFSSINGFLGSSNFIDCRLSSGVHTISASLQAVTQKLTLTVLPRTLKPLDEVTVLLHTLPLSVRLTKGTYLPYLVSCGGSAKGLSITADQALLSTLLQSQSIRAVSDTDLLRDFKIPLVNKNMLPYRILPELQKNERMQTTVRSFYVINTASQFSNPHTVMADLWYDSQFFEVWKPVDFDPTEADFSVFFAKLEDQVFPRVKAIWGDWADIDNNKKIIVLFSQTINDEKVATGFFNPADFFANNKDASSENYNPASNEADILYLAFPDQSESTYSVDSILATIAHELTHAVTFTQKTWNKVLAGNTNFPQEEVYLEEGWSHLSENLCGFGFSGGNYLFFERYIQNPSSYSFCAPNELGQADSAGMRGAMTLFLSYLFQKKGGIQFDADGNVIPELSGGIAFLRSLVASDFTGWDSIGKVFGEDTATLFTQMARDMAIQIATGTPYEYAKDPATKEPLDFFVLMIPSAVPALTSAASCNVLPWSLRFFSNNTVTNSSLFKITGTLQNSPLYLKHLLSE